jgi:hypothetical protein
MIGNAARVTWNGASTFTRRISHTAAAALDLGGNGIRR